MARRKPQTSRPARRAPIIRLDSEATLQRALVELQALDPDVITPILASSGAVELRHRAASFEGLASIIVSQQVSTASANAIFARTRTLLDPFEPATFLAATESDLRQCGLSAAKIRTLRAVAEAIGAGLDLSALALVNADDALTSLVAIKGIGPWTAEIFLMFCLGHADVWPVGDLALQEAVKLALALETRPAAADLRIIGERWRPYRAVAARLFWAYHRVRQADGRGKPG